MRYSRREIFKKIFRKDKIYTIKYSEHEAICNKTFSKNSDKKIISLSAALENFILSDEVYRVLNVSEFSDFYLVQYYKNEKLINEMYKIDFLKIELEKFQNIKILTVEEVEKLMSACYSNEIYNFHLIATAIVKLQGGTI